MDMAANFSENIFDRANRTIRQTEGSVVNLVSSLAPWGAPLPAMYMSYMHMIDTLKFPKAIAIPVAGVIEILGFSVVSTILSFWMHNRKYKDEAKKSPVILVIAAFAFYLGIILTMNVLIDASTGEWWAEGAIIAVRALLTMMSIPAALVLAVRTQHQEMLNDFEETARERAFKKHYGDQWFEMMYGVQGSKGSMNPSEPRKSGPSEKKLATFAYLEQFKADNNRLPTIDEMIAGCGISQGSASQWRKEWLQTNPDTVSTKE